MANLPKIALGAWAWGNDGTFGNSLTAESLKPIFDTAMANGLNVWDAPKWTVTMSWSISTILSAGSWRPMRMKLC